MFIDAFLGLCIAVGTGTAAEPTDANYARQPISFSTPVAGLCRNATPWNFGLNPAQPAVGRAIYDAPTSGDLLLVLPWPAGAVPVWGPADAGDVGAIVLSLTALAAYQNAAAFSGSIAAGATAGICWRVPQDVVGTFDGPSGNYPTAIPLPGGQRFQQVKAGTVTAGVQLSINRGQLMAHGAFVS